MDHAENPFTWVIDNHDFGCEHDSQSKLPSTAGLPEFQQSRPIYKVNPCHGWQWLITRTRNPNRHVSWTTAALRSQRRTFLVASQKLRTVDCRLSTVDFQISKLHVVSSKTALLRSIIISLFHYFITSFLPSFLLLIYPILLSCFRPLLYFYFISLTE